MSEKVGTLWILICCQINYEKNLYDVNKRTAPGGLETEKWNFKYERQ